MRSTRKVLASASCRILCGLAVLTWGTAALANAPAETVATPTMGESALLSLSVVLPAIGVLVMRRRIKRG